MTKQVISFHYRLTDSKGKQVDSSAEAGPISFLEGAGQIIPGLETELMPLQTGDKKTVNIAYKDAYGAYDQSLVVKVPRDKFPSQELKVGDVFQVNSGEQHQVVMVVEINEDQVTVDANHPLAGQDLTFDVEITGRRDATADEVQHGHAHGPHGHSHH